MTETVTDVVNAYFRQFYPPDLTREDFTYCSMLGGMLEYKHRGKYDTRFPPMVCADGFKMSVQGHYGTYSHPRDDFADRYSAVEVGFPSEREELLMPYIDGGPDTDPTDTVYGYVPVEVIEQIVEPAPVLVQVIEGKQHCMACNKSFTENTIARHLAAKMVQTKHAKYLQGH